MCVNAQQQPSAIIFSFVLFLGAFAFHKECTEHEHADFQGRLEQAEVGKCTPSSLQAILKPAWQHKTSLAVRCVVEAPWGEGGGCWLGLVVIIQMCGTEHLVEPVACVSVRKWILGEEVVSSCWLSRGSQHHRLQ